MEYTNWDAFVDVRLSSETDPMLRNESSSTMDVLLELNFQTIKRWLDDRCILTREDNEPAISRFTCVDFTAAYDELKQLLVEELETYGMSDRYKKEQLVDEGIHLARAIGRMGHAKSILVFRITKYLFYTADESLLQSGRIRGDRPMVPASMEAIVSLPKKKDGDEVESCSVCLEELPMGVVVSTLLCSHIFYGDCILKWLKKSHSCPICRIEMPNGYRPYFP